MYVAKVENGECKVFNENGQIIRGNVGGPGAASASVDGDKVAVTFTNGQVKLFQLPSGQILRSF